CSYVWLFFFFQAEDGIRDFHVTGVQTCALPIYTASMIRSPNGSVQVRCAPRAELYQWRSKPSISNIEPMPRLTTMDGITRLATRSEERRVGKEGRTRWGQEH